MLLWEAWSPGPLTSISACFTSAGAQFSNAKGAGQGSWQAAHLSSFTARDEQEQQQPALPAVSVPVVSRASVRPNAVRLASLLSCSTGSSSGIATPFAAQPLARSISTLAHGKRGLPLLPGMGPTSNQMLVPKPSSAPTRSFYTEGEVFGTVYQFTTNFMFWSGIIGAAAFRRNLIVLMLSSEIVMLACNMNFLFASAYLNDITGVIMSITITTIAACETAIGLALCVAYFHMRSAIDVESLNLLK